MTRLRLSLFFLLLLAPLTTTAQTCRPQLVLEPPVADQWLLEQLADGQVVRVPFRIEVEASESGCPFLVGFELENPIGIAAQVEQRPFSQALLDISAADPRRLLSGVTDRDRPSSFDLDLVIRPEPGLAAQDMQLLLSPRVYSGSDPADAIETDRSRDLLMLEIPADASLIVDADGGRQLLGSGPSFLTLGDLVSGARGEAHVTLEGNVGVTLNVSAASGELVHTEFSEYTVPYTLTLGGAGTGWSLERRMEPGDMATIAVDVGQLESMVAGDYQDRLLITISAD